MSEPDGSVVDAPEEPSGPGAIVVESEPRERGADLGVPGRPFNRSSPFVIGLTATLGVAVAYGLVQAVVQTGQILSLIAVALVLAIGIDPVVRFLTRHHLSRPWAVAVVTLVFLGVLAVILALAVSPISQEAHKLSDNLPRYRTDIAAGEGTLGRIATKLDIEDSFAPGAGGGGIDFDFVGGAFGAGAVAVSAVTALILLLVLTVYFLAALPAMEATALRLVPASRRERARVLTNEAFIRIGGFVLGNLITSVIAGVVTYAWAQSFGLPYPVLLGVMVAIADLIPIIGSTGAGLVVALVALTNSVAVAIATVAFYVAFRFLEDYLLTPRIMARTVKISAGVTIIATLAGGTLFGIVGALVAIPVAAVIQLLLEETAFPRMDRT